MVCFSLSTTTPSWWRLSCTPVVIPGVGQRGRHANDALLPTAQCGVRQAGAALAHVPVRPLLFDALQQNAGALYRQSKFELMRHPPSIRVVTILPLTFVALAATEIAWTWRFRDYWSPVPGCAAGLALIVCAGIAVRTIWFRRPSAPLAIAVSGVSAFGLVLAVPWLFPLVNTTTEEPTLFQRFGYPVTLAAIALCSVVSVRFVNRALQRARHT